MVPFYETKLGLSNRFILDEGKRSILGEGSNKSRTGKGTGRSGVALTVTSLLVLGLG